MTQARRLLPGATQFVTRRTAGRRCYLLPTPEATAITSYAFALAASRYPTVRVLATCWLSNHHHGGYVDSPGASLLPDFFRDVHSLTARALNAHLGRSENLWRAGSYGNVEVRTPHDLEEQLLYVWCQPVAAGLVERPELWPGLSLSPEDFGRTITVEKPSAAIFGARRPRDHVPTYGPSRARVLKEREQRAQESRAQRRREDQRRGRGKRRSAQLERERLRRQNTPCHEPTSSLPEVVSYTVGVPPGWEHRPLEETRRAFRERLERRLEEIHALRAEAGLTRFIGLSAVLEQSAFAAPAESPPGFKLDPRIAAKDKHTRIGLLRELRGWRRRYANARKAWAQGKRDVIFPAGSYELPRYHAARVEDAPAPPRFLR